MNLEENFNFLSDLIRDHENKESDLINITKLIDVFYADFRNKCLYELLKEKKLILINRLKNSGRETKRIWLCDRLPSTVLDQGEDGSIYSEITC